MKKGFISLVTVLQRTRLTGRRALLGAGGTLTVIAFSDYHHAVKGK